MSDYKFSDLVRAYEQVGVDNGGTIYLTGNFGKLGSFEELGKPTLLNAHLAAIQSLIGKTGTIVVPTHSWSLYNSNVPFSIPHTASETGPFSEFLRTLPGSVRQFHPFSSSTALGAEAKDICLKNTRHVYGPNSPFARLVERDALHLSVGLPVNRTISLVHHAELVAGVPYRYTKEFIHPYIEDGQTKLSEFYLFVTRRDVDIERDQNRRFLDYYLKHYPVLECPLGRSKVQSVRFGKFFEKAVELLSIDIYAWLKKPPSNRESYQR